jgi:hypothetical protein
MFVNELAKRQAKVRKDINRVMKALRDVDDRRNQRGTDPRTWWHLTDLLEELLDDLHVLMIRRELLDES